VALGLGVLVKLYPLALVPALGVAWLLPLDLNRLARYGTAVVATILVGLVPFTFVAGSAALGSLSYQAQRGLQIESIGGGLVVLGGLVTGERVGVNAPFNSIEVTGPTAAVILAVLPVLTALGFAVLAWLGWHRLRRDVAVGGQVSAATVVMVAAGSMLVLLATNKVFSIQYVVWFLPFAVLLPRAQFLLAAVIVGLTMPIHPLLYGRLVEQEAVPILLLNLRNVLVVLLLGGVFAHLRKDTA
jgi:hypothetical protein